MNDSGSTIVVGYDGRDDAAAAIRAAGPLLAPARAVVACVWESFAELILHTDLSSLSGTMREAADEFDADARERAHATAAEGAALAGDAGFEPEAVEVLGKPRIWPSLLRIADERDADAIVLGGEGIGPMKAALLGSVASGVIHHSKRPVLLVPPGQGIEVNDRPLLIAYDGSEHARRAIVAAGGLMPGRDAIVRTVWTSLEGVAAVSQIGLPAGLGTGGVEALDAELQDRAQANADEGARLAEEAGLHAVSAAVRADANVCHTLLDPAWNGEVAAIVAGSRGRSVISDILLGSVSAGLVHRSPVPVLVVPAPA
jgi:nucleotide-binding universal stress UspA family protein